MIISWRRKFSLFLVFHLSDEDEELGISVTSSGQLRGDGCNVICNVGK